MCLVFLLTAATIASGQLVGCDNDTYQCYVCLYDNCFGSGQSYKVNVCVNISLDCFNSPGNNDSVCVQIDTSAPVADTSANTTVNRSQVIVLPSKPCTNTICDLGVRNAVSNTRCTVFASSIISAAAKKQYADERYTFPLAVATRQRHFYCPGFGKNGVSGHPDSVNDNSSYWTVFLQYPLLSYMDNARKWSLFRVLLENAGRSVNDLANLCIGNYTQYGVSTYNEGMLLHLYFKNSTGVNIDQLNKVFTGNMSGFTTFLGKQALNVTKYWSDYQVQTSDVQPYFLRRPTGLGLTTIEDPTLHAVYLGSWSGYFPLEMVLHHVQGRFASNPNPVDYGLEVGDYFFAVFGSIFVFLLLVVIVIGFIIHPLLLDN